MTKCLHKKARFALNVAQKKPQQFLHKSHLFKFAQKNQSGHSAYDILLFKLAFQVDKKTGEKSKTRPRFVKQDQIAICRFAADDVICMETFKDHPQLGRFTLRDEGTFLPNFEDNVFVLC